MSAVFRVIFVSAFLSILFGAASCQNEMPAGRQSDADIEKAILKVQSAMQKAAEKLDADALYKYVLDTDKGAIIENGRLFLTREDALESTKRGLKGLKALSYSYSRKYITVMSPTSALWVGEGTTTATIADGRQITSPFAESIVFVNRGGKWRVLHAHRSAPLRP